MEFPRFSVSSAPDRGEGDPTDGAILWIRRLVYGLVGLTLGLMALGSLTRVMGAGLACPDWPLCYGKIVPPMDQFIFLEWFHRQIATLVGLLTVGLFGLSLWARQRLPRWIPGFATVALVLVIAQGALGALTVTQYLRFDIVTAHLGTAMLYFGTLLAAAAALTAGPTRKERSEKLAWVALGGAFVCYTQIILGGLVASQWAVNQCLAGSTLCNVMHTHLLGVIPATLAVLGTAFVAWRAFRREAQLLLGLLVLQIGLGVSTFSVQLSVAGLTVAHLTVGAMLFGGLVWLCVRAFRQDNADMQISG